MTRSAILFAVVTLTAAPALAKQSAWPADQLGKETSIPFVGTIGLYDFEADGDRGVWLQDQRQRWYYARVVGPCTGLPFATRIGIDTRFGGNQLDRSGSLLVDRDNCKIDSLTASAGPPKRVKKKG